MSQGKGTEDFEAYVRNLQLAVENTSIGGQLVSNGDSRPRRSLVHNPYGVTVADLGICRYRTTGGPSSGR